jgi:serine protease inhibitor
VSLLYKMHRIFSSASANSNTNTEDCVGDITGREFSVSSIDHGMPIRSVYYGKKLDREQTSLRARSDFDLFSRHGQIPFDLYNTDSTQSLSININNFSINLFSLLRNKSIDSFCVCPLGLFNIFAILYFASKGNTESDLSAYLSMTSKTGIFERLNFIKSLCDEPVLSKQMVIKDIILVNDAIQTNRDFVQQISSIVDVQPVSVDNHETEADNINNYISKLCDSGLVVHKVSSKIIAKAEVIALNCGFIRPIWQKPFGKIFSSKFFGRTNRIVKMMGQIDGKYDYYEDDLFRLIEFKCIPDASGTNTMSMGVILGKNTETPELSLDRLVSLMKNLKSTCINEVRIPCFSQQVKMKLTNLLYQDGLKSVFHTLLVPEFTRKETKISDVVQNITVIVDSNSNSNSNNNTSISNIKFIADRPFVYYFKMVPTNTLALIGYYC